MERREEAHRLTVAFGSAARRLPVIHLESAMVVERLPAAAAFASSALLFALVAAAAGLDSAGCPASAAATTSACHLCNLLFKLEEAERELRGAMSLCLSYTHACSTVTRECTVFHEGFHAKGRMAFAAAPGASGQGSSEANLRTTNLLVEFDFVTCVFGWCLQFGWAGQQRAR